MIQPNDSYQYLVLQGGSTVQFSPPSAVSGNSFKYIALTFSKSNDRIRVYEDGVELGSGEYDYDADTEELEVTVSLSSGNEIVVKYNYYKYSDTELNSFVTASLVWISAFSYTQTDYEVEDDDIYPTPDQKTTDLIALISSILIKPDWTAYSLPNVKVAYSNRLSKEEKITKLISRFQMGIGVNEIIEL